MDRGYIKLWRCIQDNPLWFHEPFSRSQAWLDMLMLANHRDGHIRVRGIVVPLKRGDLGWSIVSLASRWKWSRGKVTRFLNELKTVQQIEQQNNHVTSLISIINYEIYQQDDTTKRAANGQQTDTNKNVKNKTLLAAPEIFTFTDHHKKLAEEAGENIQNQYDAFRDYHLSKGSKFKDWSMAFNTWLRNAKTFKKGNTPPPQVRMAH